MCWAQYSTGGIKLRLAKMHSDRYANMHKDDSSDKSC